MLLMKSPGAEIDTGARSNREVRRVPAALRL